MVSEPASGRQISSVSTGEQALIGLKRLRGLWAGARKQQDVECPFSVESRLADNRGRP